MEPSDIRDTSESGTIKTQQISLQLLSNETILRASGELPNEIVDSLPSFEHCDKKIAKAWRAEIVGDFSDYSESEAPALRISYKCENGCNFEIITFLDSENYFKLFETRIVGDLNSHGTYEIWFAGSFPIWTLPYDRFTEWDAGVDASQRRKLFLKEFDQLLTPYILEVAGND